MGALQQAIQIAAVDGLEGLLFTLILIFCGPDNMFVGKEITVRGDEKPAAVSQSAFNRNRCSRRLIQPDFWESRMPWVSKVISRLL